MNILRKIYRRVRMEVSRIRTPKHARTLRHLHVQGFEMLAFANEDVGRQIWLFGTFEPDETNFFRSLIRPDDICFDIGGNVGYFSMLMAKCAADGEVHVFEPIPLNAALIRTNAELNGFVNLVVNQGAVGRSEGITNFSVSTDSAYSSMRATGRFAETKSIEVPLFTLDAYVTKHGIKRIDVIKVDVEGAEDMVLEGGTKLLGNPACRPRIILLELFDENLLPFGTCVGKVIDRMATFGYRPQALENGGFRLIDYKPEMAKRFYNIIFCPD